MTPPPEDLTQRLAAALERLGAVARAHAARRAPAAGLSALQGRALHRLARGDGPRLSVLAEELNVGAATLSEAISTLVEKGLVAKEVDPAEHRAVQLFPTSRGASLARSLAAEAADWLAPAASDLGPEQQGRLLSLLLELIRSLELRGAIARARTCLGCRFFQRDAHRGERPHHCRLLDAPIGPVDLRVDCDEFESAWP